MEVYLSKLGPKYFLVLEDCASIPLDGIKEFRYNPPNGGCSNSIAIILDETVSHLEDPNYIFAYENADAIKEFLRENKASLSERFEYERNEH